MHGPTSPSRPAPRNNWRRRWFRRLAAAAVLFAAGSGCTRKFFRQKADNDVTGVITQKNIFPDWQIENWYVYPDPRSRFADPTNPDRPPYPPDDYAAWYLSPNPQVPRKKPGIGRVEGTGYYDLLTGYDLENRAIEQIREREEAKKDNPDGAETPKQPEPIPAPQPANPVPPAKLPDVNPERIEPPKGSRPMSMLPPVGPRLAVRSQEPRDIAFRPIPPRPAPPGPPSLPSLPEPIGLKPAVIAAAGPVSPVQGGGTPQIVALSGPLSPVLGGEGRGEGAKRQQAGRSLPSPGPQSRPGLAPQSRGEEEDPSRRRVAVAPAPRMVSPRPGVVPAAFVQPLTPPADGAAAAPGPTKLPDPAADYLQALASQESAYKVRLEQAIELGVVNAREFQDRREDVYLAALPVTLQRFSFAAQPFFMTEAIREITGAERPEGAGNRWRINNTTGFNRTFSTGAQLMFQIANQFVIDITGDKPYTSISNLTLNLTQPLLQGGGKAVTLEPLTQAERTLLYAIRSYARFRRIFYVAIAAGGGYTNNPYGLQGLSANLGRGVGNNLTSPSVGYLPLMLQSAIISNQRKNVQFLEDLLKLYQAFREGGQQSDLQVGQVEQNLLSARTSLLGSTNTNLAGGGGSSSGIRGYMDTLDNFKLQLGLPETLSLELDDTPLRPVRRQITRFEAVYQQVRDLEDAARRYDPAEDPAASRGRWVRLLTDSELVRGTDFAADVRRRWAIWEKLTDDGLIRRIGDLQEQRRKLLDAKADRQLKGEAEPEAEVRALDRLNAEIDLGRFEAAVRRYASQPWAKEKGPVRSTVQAAAFRDEFNAFYQLILEGRNERLAEIRSQWPKLPGLLVEGCDLLDVPLDDAYTVGIRTALTHRLDLMNSRAQVVDSYRQIAVTANALQGVLNVSYNLDSTTQPGTADLLSFSGSRSRHQLAINAELPLVRRTERNAYRAALIGYQRQRRSVMAFEDNIANDVRGDIRELRAFAEQYRIQQRVVELGYSVLDNSQAILLAPPAPGAQADAGQAAALTQQVLNAQSSLLSAQNLLYTIWVNYILSRMQLYLDLEMLPLDNRGIWIDEFPSPEPDNRPDPAPARDAQRVGPPRPDDAERRGGGVVRAAR